MELAINYDYEKLKYHSIIIIERILKELGVDAEINGTYLKIQNKAEDIGELEIECDKELMIVKIKMFLIENNSETAIEIGIVKSLKNFYDGEIYSTVVFYDFINN